MPEPTEQVESDTFERAVDLGRFGPRARRMLSAALVAVFIAMAFAVWPVVWRLLDTAAVLGDAAGSGALVTQDADLAYGRLYTAAHVVSILPFLVAVSTLLFWRRRHAAADRLPTGLLVALATLCVLQLASISVAWGDQFTGRAIQESMTDARVSIWGRDVIERAWYAGYATQAVTAALGSAVLGLGPRRGWWVFSTGFAATVPAVWFVLGRSYLG